MQIRLLSARALRTAFVSASAAVWVVVLTLGCSSGNMQASSTEETPPADATAATDGDNAAIDANAKAAPPSATPSSTSTPAPVTAAQSRRLACKRGVSAESAARAALSAKDLAALSANVTWWYNWTSGPGTPEVAAASQKLAMDYVPMVWTAPFDVADLAAKVPAGSKYLLAFNEPNFTVQGNLSPEQAASYWPQLEKFADDHNLAIVSPAINYCGGACNETDPFVWFDRFFAACKTCRVDYLAIHAYVCYGSALQSVYLKPFAQKYGKKLWLTEFSCGDGSADDKSLAQQKRYMQESVAALEADDNVFRYSWFLARADTTGPAIGLLASDGTLSELGKYYLSLPQNCTP